MILPLALALTTSPAKVLPCFSSSPLTHGDHLHQQQRNVRPVRPDARALGRLKLQNRVL